MYVTLRTHPPTAEIKIKINDIFVALMRAALQLLYYYYSSGSTQVQSWLLEDIKQHWHLQYLQRQHQLTGRTLSSTKLTNIKLRIFYKNLTNSGYDIKITLHVYKLRTTILVSSVNNTKKNRSVKNLPFILAQNCKWNWRHR